MRLDPEAPVVAESRYVYENRWIRVREDALLRPDGSAGLYAVVERADFAIVIPCYRRGLMLVEQYRHPLRRRSLEFPQGAHEDAPGRPLDAVARAELLEETGLRAGNLRPLGVINLAVGLSPQAGHVFLATGLESGRPNRSVEEQDMRNCHVTVARFRELIADGLVSDAATLAAWSLFLNSCAR